MKSNKAVKSLEIMEMNIEMMNVVSVTSLLMKTLENATKEYARSCVKRCSEMYGFNSEEAEKALNLENLTIQVREMKKRSGAKEKKEIKKKETNKKEKKSSMPMPFIYECVNKDGCHGLAYNGGLFTQCEKKKMDESNYCKGCQLEADKSASGIPSNGTIEERIAKGLMDYKDPKGRSPIAYSKIMEKHSLTRELVESEAGKQNKRIDEIHFAIVEKKEKKEKVGRPKAQKKKVTTQREEVEDLFSGLVFEDEDEEEKNTVIMNEDEEDEEKKQQLEAEKEAKKQQLEAEKEAKKEPKKEAKKESKKEAKKETKNEAKKETKVEEVKEVAAAPKKVTVKRITIEGKQYLKTAENLLYDPETKEEMGIYDPETNTIKDLPNDSEDEVEEDGYSSE